MKNFIGKHCDWVALTLMAIALPLWLVIINSMDNLGEIFLVTVLYTIAYGLALIELMKCERDYRRAREEARKRHIAYRQRN